MRERFLQFIVWVVERSPWAAAALALGLAAVLGWLGRDPELRSSQLDMIPRENPVVKRWTDFTDDFDILADLFVVVRTKKLDDAKAFARQLDTGLKAFPKFVRGVEYRLNPKLYENQALYFTTLDVVKGMEQTVRDQKTDLLLLARQPGFAGLSGVLLDELRREQEAKAEDVKGFMNFIRKVARRLEEAAAGRKPEQMPWRNFFGMPDQQDNKDDPFADGGWKLSTAKDGLLIAVHPADSTDDFDFIVPFYETCRKVVDKLKVRYPGLEVGLTGQPAMNYSQRDTVGNDLEVTSIVSLVGVSLIFIWGFRGIGLPILSILSLVSAIAWTFGVLHFSPGHLNLITTAFVSMLLGLGMDYGIYVASQFGERRRRGLPVGAAVHEALTHAGPGILTGALTTCAGFLALKMTDFTGFQELGQIAGAGILLCMLAMLVLLPSLLTLAGRFAPGLGLRKEGRTETLLEWLARFSVEHSLPVLIVFGGFALVLLAEGSWVEFDYNILNLEPENTEPVIYDRIMQKDFEIAPDTVMVTAKTLDGAAALKKRLEKLSAVGNIDSLTNYFPARPEEKRAVMRRIAEQIRDIRFGRCVPLDCEALAVNLDSIAAELRGMKLGLLMKYDGELVLAASDAEDAARDAARAIRSARARNTLDRLGMFQTESFSALSDGFEDFRAMLTVEPFKLEKLPAPIRARYQGTKSGRYVLFVSPSIDVREEVQAQLFISQVAEVEPGATGVPILLDEVLRLLRRGFRQATAYSLAAVVLLVLLDFRNVKLTLLALAPLLVSLSITVGLMRLANLKYNPANFVSIPILTGLGMAYGVYLIHRLRQEPEGGPVRAIRTTGKSVVLSGLASMMGFGSLMLAQNRGLYSLGRIVFMGLACCLVTSLVMLPALAQAVGYREERLRDRLLGLWDELMSFRF